MDLENIFIASVIFGPMEKTHLVFAENKQDAIETIKKTYMNPEIGFMVSYDEVNKLYHLAKEPLVDGKSLIWVIEMIREGNINKFIEHEEWTVDISEIQEKYKNRDCLFFDRLFILELAKMTNDMLVNSKEQPLISKNISL